MGCSKGSPRPYEKAHLWRCLSPNDQERLLRACKLGTGAPRLNYCTIYVDAQGPVAVCADGTVEWPWKLSSYACLSAADSERLLIYCRRDKP
jgi:hypothetical protein